jgi:hypothetical protein
MNTIPSVFTERGFDHREIERNGDWRLFERTRHGRSHWEVVRIRERGETVMFGKVIEASEVYPCSEKWGIDGFTCTCLDSARFKLVEVAERQNAIKTSPRQNVSSN